VSSVAEAQNILKNGQFRIIYSKELDGYSWGVQKKRDKVAPKRTQGSTHGLGSKHLETRVNGFDKWGLVETERKRKKKGERTATKEGLGGRRSGRGQTGQKMQTRCT